MLASIAVRSDAKPWTPEAQLANEAAASAGPETRTRFMP
jgi:hypothetical protein